MQVGRLCSECGESIHDVDGLWRHKDVNRVCRDGLAAVSGTDRAEQ